MTRVVGWSFPVSVRGDVTNGSPARIVVEWQPKPDLRRETIDRVKCVGTWWARLAAEGALGGSTLPPHTVSGAPTDDQQPQETGTKIEWKLATLRIDPKALTILFNLLHQSELPISGVTVETEGADRQDVVTPRDYPERWPKPTFACRDTRESRDVVIEVTFGGDVPKDVQEPIAEALKVWALVGALGGFREIVALDTPSEIIPQDEPGYDFDLLTMTVRDRNVNEVAYDALVNLLIGIGGRHCRIAEVAIG